MDSKVVKIFVCMLLMSVIFVYQPETVKADSNTTINLFPTADAYVSRYDLNYGSADNLQVRNLCGGDSANWSRRSLVKFDVSSIPSDATIVSASLNLYYYYYKDSSPVGRSLTCRENIWDWAELNVTGPNQPQCYGNPVSYAIVPSSVGSWMSWDVTSSIQSFVDGSRSNFGWKITDDDAWGTFDIPYMKFRSKDFSDSTYWPYLSVEYNSSSQNNIPPVADFTYTSDGLNVSFTDTSTDSDGIIISHNWNFGDNSSSDEQNPTHIYASPGTYNVILTVTDNDGDMNSVNKIVLVSQDNTIGNTDSGEKEDEESDCQEREAGNIYNKAKLLEFLNKYSFKLSKLLSRLIC